MGKIATDLLIDEIQGIAQNPNTVFLLMWILNGIPPFKRDKLFPFILILPVNKHPN
jgi:hypothetical protein